MPTHDPVVTAIRLAIDALVRAAVARAAGRSKLSREALKEALAAVKTAMERDAA